MNYSRSQPTGDKSEGTHSGTTRINKYLSNLGIASRRDIDEYVLNGRIKINGSTILTPGVQVSETDIIELDGKVISVERPQDIYIILNKPKGFITTADDEYNRNHVLDLIKIKERIYPIGRLDKDTTGLLLLTNNGEMANRLMHPRYHVEKVYRALLDQPLAEADRRTLTRGIMLEADMPPTQPCEIHFYTSAKNRVEISIHEGRNRQIRRMFEALGYQVVALERRSYAGLMLEGLDSGKWRRLTSAEVQMLNKATGERS